MSFIGDHVRNVHAQLDQFHISSLDSTSQPDFRTAGASLRISQVQSLLSSLSAVTSSRPSLSQRTPILSILRQSRQDRSADVAARGDSSGNELEAELEWLLLGKAAVQTYGLVLDAYLRQTEPINNELWYWGDVLSSYRNTGLYSIQTSPVRLWHWGLNVYRDMQEREDVVSQNWRSFYDLARKVIQERSMADVQKRVVSPLVLIRTEIRQKRERLEQGKASSAGGLGYMLRNSFSHESFGDITSSQRSLNNSANKESQNWKFTIVKSVNILKSILLASIQADMDCEAFEKLLEDAGSLAVQTRQQLDIAASLNGLEDVLDTLLPQFLTQSQRHFEASKRPGLITRYWLPVTALVFSSSTILRYLVNRKEAIVQWINEFGVTVRDFWINWIIEPSRKVIGTIRHDESSEVSIMSKRSLEGDRESLERMVIDFAMDNPSSPLDEAQITDLKARVREGDLTPVLKAYEKDLHSPFWGTIKGNLIRALLIQVQKTKVDVEIAMGGIDSLLKSQELVFGFVGLTPGILVVFGLVRWLRQLSSDRRSYRSSEQQSQSYMALRNMDRILTIPGVREDSMLSFKAYGLLVCEASILREYAAKILPKNVFRQFKEDFDDLLDGSSKVSQQQRVVDRIRWAYARWF